MPIKVALVHDWLVSYRGGERVLEALCELYPQAPIYTLFYKKGTVGRTIEDHPIHVSFLNSLPRATKYYRYLLPLFPMAIERFDLSGYDLVISTSHCVAKGVIVPQHSLHVCYCFTPMRYIWDRSRDYFRGWKESLLLPFLHYLRLWDVASSARVDHFIGISQYIRRRIQKYYRREASVIYPPVNVHSFRPSAGDLGDYYLTVAAFAPYKRLDLAIEACHRLGRKLLVVGGGQEAKNLKAMPGNHVTFLGHLSDEALAEVYAGAKAFLFPAEEDFGIAPVEAMACGRPVIAFARGGAAETVIENITGIFFHEQTVESLCEAILYFEKTSSRFSSHTCRERAEQFHKQRFLDEFKLCIDDLWNTHQKKPLPDFASPLART